MIILCEVSVFELSMKIRCINCQDSYYFILIDIYQSKEVYVIRD